MSVSDRRPEPEVRAIGSRLKEYRDFALACDASLSRKAISRDKLSVRIPELQEPIFANLCITHDRKMSWVYASAPGIPVHRFRIEQPKAKDVDRVQWWKPF